MIENVTTFIIISGSSLLFVYWFRYVCLLVLTAKPTRDYAAIAASANRLRFLEVQMTLRGGALADITELGRLLDRDYQMLSYLLTHAANAPTGVAAIEKRMLEIDYRLIRFWCRISSRFSPEAAIRALDEMSCIVAHFANAMGERMAGVVVQ